MQKTFTLLTAIFSVLLFSCQKEADLQGISTSGETNAGAGAIDLAGTWKFINLHAKTTATNEMLVGTDKLKTVTTSDYTTENNTGTVNFTTQGMNYDNFSYAVNTIARATTYENGALIDTFSLPIQVSIPAMKGQSTFTRVGNDSLYFQGGSSMLGGASQPTEPSGAKIKRELDKLYLLQKVAQTKTTTEQGQTVKLTQEAEIVTTFQKQ
jgi:hypothetical protein